MEQVNKAHLMTLLSLCSAAGEIPSKIDEQLGAARADNPPVNENPHIVEAHTQTGKLGLKIEAIAQWARERLQALEPAPPKDNAPTAFENRNAFDVYLPNWQQQVILDGQVVKSGFGPPMEWFSNDDGTITRERKAAPTPEPAQPPVVIPPSAQAIIEMRAGQGTPWMGMVGGEIRRVRMLDDADISSTVGSGGNYMHGFVSDSETSPTIPFPKTDAHKEQQGGTPYQSIKAGQIYHFFYDPDGVNPDARKNVRVTTRSPVL